MRAPRWMGMGIGAALLAAAGGGAAAPQAAADCAPVGEIRFICDLISPEDLAVLPGEEWVIASGNQEGGMIHLVNVGDKTSSVLYPTDAPRERLDAETYPDCPGPIDPGEGAAFRAHGLYLAPGEDGVHTVYLVHHGFRESVEVFEVDGNANPPELTWVGCAVAPEPLTLNSVVALPDGGFAATSFRTAGLTESLADIQTGAISGSVWEWRTDGGWTEVPGSADRRPQRPGDIRTTGSGSTSPAGASSASSACRAAAIPSSATPSTCTSGPTTCACSPTGRSSPPAPTASTRRRRRSTSGGSTRGRWRSSG